MIIISNFSLISCVSRIQVIKNDIQSFRFNNKFFELNLSSMIVFCNQVNLNQSMKIWITRETMLFLIRKKVTVK